MPDPITAQLDILIAEAEALLAEQDRLGEWMTEIETRGTCSPPESERLSAAMRSVERRHAVVKAHMAAIKSGNANIGKSMQ